MIQEQRTRKAIIIGCDHRGREVYHLIAEVLRRNGLFRLIDANPEGENGFDYADVASRAAWKISAGEAECGILVCGTGIGMCIVANKFPGIRAAPCHNEVMAELSRKHNDSNILCLSGDMLGERSSISIVEKWLSTPFSGGRHAERLEKLRSLESSQYSNRLHTNTAVQHGMVSVQ